MALLLFQMLYIAMKRKLQINKQKQTNYLCVSEYTETEKRERLLIHFWSVLRPLVYKNPNLGTISIIQY